VPDTALVAVGSRGADAAAQFGRRFDVPNVHVGYERLAEDPAVDVVYVATPQSRHHADARLFLAAGKAVLCEKPFTMDAAEAEDLVAMARAAGVFLMEAMWMRFLPVHTELRRLVAAGAIGTPHLLSADFGYRADPTRHRRLFDPALGGGSLLDLGVYPVALATSLFGAPDRVAALDRRLGDVDGQTGALLAYPDGAMAVLHSTILGDTPSGASVSGTAGRIALERPFHASTALTLHTAAGVERIGRPFDGVGLHHEAAEVVACLRAGRLESEAMPLSDSVAVMRTLDRIRACARADAVVAG
jgi:predicted dehydrogenase